MADKGGDCEGVDSGGRPILDTEMALSDGVGEGADCAWRFGLASERSEGIPKHRAAPVRSPTSGPVTPGPSTSESVRPPPSAEGPVARGSVHFDWRALNLSPTVPRRARGCATGGWGRTSGERRTLTVTVVPYDAAFIGEGGDEPLVPKFVAIAREMKLVALVEAVGVAQRLEP